MTAPGWCSNVVAQEREDLFVELRAPFGALHRIVLRQLGELAIVLDRMRADRLLDLLVELTVAERADDRLVRLLHQPDDERRELGLFQSIAVLGLATRDDRAV